MDVCQAQILNSLLTQEDMTRRQDKFSGNFCSLPLEILMWDGREISVRLSVITEYSNIFISLSPRTPSNKICSSRSWKKSSPKHEFQFCGTRGLKRFRDCHFIMLKLICVSKSQQILSLIFNYFVGFCIIKLYAK